MKTLPVSFHPAAFDDLARIWDQLVVSDGVARADQIIARIEAACVSIGAVPHVGTRRDDIATGLRSTGIRSMPKSGVILFRVTSTQVWIMRIGFQGNDVWSDVPRMVVENPIDVSGGGEL